MKPEISSDGTYLTVLLCTGTARFHAVWLRDNARDPETISPQNGQRIITLLDQPLTITLQAAKVVNQDTLRIRFHGNPVDYNYPLDWLQAHRYDRHFEPSRGWTNQHIERWGRELQSQIPTAEYGHVLACKSSLGKWLSTFRAYGFAMLTDLPEDPDSLLSITDLFGFVRETNYGRYFDVRTEVNPINLAFTALGLQAHTDNPYRDPVPTLQILACVENSVEGGESIVVDGFNTVATLQKENPTHFDLLSGYCARFRYAGSKGVDLASKRPMIELNPDGELIAVRFNNRSAAPFTDIPFEQMQAYYQAYRHFAEILARDENKVQFKLQAQELFIVDNTRVMHSRKAFSSSGSRWLRGWYADKDGLLSTLSVIQSQASVKQ